MKYISLIVFCLSANIVIAQECSGPEHSVNIHDSWVSCNMSNNPNPVRGNSHWVLYDLGYQYHIESTYLWNYNVENETDQGMKSVYLDISQDGVNWTEVSYFDLAKATGNASYTGEWGPNINGAQCRYVLFTCDETWGDVCAGLSEVRLDIMDGSLPIELLTFAASPEEEYIGLNWAATQRINFSHFELERKRKEETFERIARIDDDLNLNSVYSFDDLDVISGVDYYYRLKMVDADGVYNYSEIRRAALSSLTKVLIFPNPVRDKLSIQMDGVENYEYVILNVSGNEMARGMSFETQKNIDVSYLPRGSYFLKIISEHKDVWTNRFVKIGL